ncbi:MAG: oligosaccharide flippase family protein [Alphaproteobacteria bacterium]|nr:oligosaccharide flippase family protein [Alphaproteobacteria bacterium]
MLKKGKIPSPRSFFADAISVIRTRIMLQIVGILTSIITARYLGPDGKGLVTALTAVPLILVRLSELGIRQSAAFYVGRKLASIEEITSALAILCVVTSLLSALVCLIYFWATWLPQYDWALIALALALLPLSITRSYISGIFLGVKQIGRFNSIGWLPAAFTLLFVCLFVVALGWDAFGMMLGSVLASVIVTVLAIRMLASMVDLRFAIDARLMVNLIRLGAVYALAVFLLQLNYRVGVILLQQFGTLEDVGLFSLGTNFADLIWEIPFALHGVILSRSVTATNEALFSKNLLSLLRLTMAAALICGAGLAIAGPILIPLVYGHEFAPAVSVVNWMLPGIIAYVAFQVLNTDLSGKGRPWASLLIAVPSIAINAVLCVALIPLYGADGAAMAASASYLFATVAITLVYARMQSLKPSQIVLFAKDDVRLLAAKVPALMRVKFLAEWLK